MLISVQPFTPRPVATRPSTLSEDHNRHRLTRRHLSITCPAHIGIYKECCDRVRTTLPRSLGNIAHSSGREQSQPQVRDLYLVNPKAFTP
jgi:hypothetical protein